MQDGHAGDRPEEEHRSDQGGNPSRAGPQRRTVIVRVSLTEKPGAPLLGEHPALLTFFSCGWVGLKSPLVEPVTS